MDKRFNLPTVVIVMGVSGSGKSTVGQALADSLNWPFYDADDFHPAGNVAKMLSGRALTDADRRPWLEALHQLIAKQIALGKPAVLACSALKRAYRDQLRAGNEGILFVYLQGDYDLIAGRVRERAGHYMPEALLTSQFEDLEEPEQALVVTVNRPVAEITSILLNQLGQHN